MILIGISLTVVAYMISLYLSKRFRISLMNPILISAAIIVATIYWTPLTYELYKPGGDAIVSVLGPLVVVLAVPLYNNKSVLLKYYKAISVGIMTGVIVSAVSVVGISLLLNLEADIIWSMLPKSITSPMAIEVAIMLDGIVELTVLFVACTGILGAAIGPSVFQLFRIKDDTAKGIGLGAASHGVGTSKAVEISGEAGAASSLAMVLSGVVTIVIAIIFVRII